MGPLLELWCMRYESKHSVLKSLANKLRNFKNIAKTLATRLQEMTFFEINGLLSIYTLELGTSSSILFGNYFYRDLLVENVEEFDDSVIIIIPKWLKYGFLYKKGFMLYNGICEDGLLQFEEIIEIIVIENNPFFITKEWHTVEFTKNFHAYKLQNISENQLNIVALTQLIFREPYNLHQPYALAEWYLVPKYICANSDKYL